MSNLKLNYSVTRSPHKIKYEIYSFARVIGSELELTPFVENCMRFRLHEIWDQQKFLFKRIQYEDILIALAMYCQEFDGGRESLNITDFVTHIWGKENVKEHLILIFKAYQTFLSIFSNQAISQ